ncbi:type 3 secretion system secretin [Cyclopterus lumpus]|uniref:type 3 secretion system secretin n=1 Tax=Cyclopterus lumpus TaxID=8103 RepID=UPI0014870DCA|nr:type 3 secretion system secretin [Cyclopterus lumpus]
MAVVASGGSGVAAAVWSHIQDLSVSASSSQSAGGGTNGGSSAGHGSDFAVDLEAAGSLSSSAASQPGNGQKLMNGGGGREGGVGADSQTVISSGVTAAPSTDQNSGSSLDSLADPAYHSDISNDQSGPDHSSLSSGLDQSLSSSVLGSSHSAVDTANASSSSHSEAHRVQIGNGRQTLLNNTNAGLHMELTGPKLGNDVTESPLAILHTDSLDSASHGYSHTDLVSMATDSTWTVTGSADPTGTPLDSSHPAVTDNTQVAGSVTEQYNPSGQGPEGTENVELEDTC